MSTRVVAVGDSLSCGEGVGIHVAPDQTWAAQLTASIPAAGLTQLSVAGARLCDVIDHQLPQALACRPDLATVLVGLNDIIRAGFGPDRFRADLIALVHALSATGATVLVATLHDPGWTRPVPLTPRLRRHLGERVAIVNDAVRDAVRDLADGRIRLLDVARIGDLCHLGAWEVDRVHPSPAGHRLIAAAAVQALHGTDLPTPAPLPRHPMPLPAGRLARASWILTCGIPWLVQHGGRVAPAAFAMGFDGSTRGEPVHGGHDRGAIQPAAVHPPPRRAYSGFGEHAGKPEVARAVG